MDEFIEFLIAHKKCLDLSFAPFAFGMLAVARGRVLSDAERTCSYGARIKINGRSVDSVFWSEERIAFYPLGLLSDSISFEFSGCVMGVFRQNMRWYATHIYAAPAGSSEKDCKRAWIDYVHAHSISHMTLFRPDYKNTGLDRETYMLWGVITKERNCYSVFVTPHPRDTDGTKYKLQYIRKHIAGSSYRDHAPLWMHGVPVTGDAETDYEQVTFGWNRFWQDNLNELCFDYDADTELDELRGVVEL